MKDYTESELEQMGNNIFNIVDDKVRYMSKENKDDLIDMLIDSLESLRDE